MHSTQLTDLGFETREIIVRQRKVGCDEHGGVIEIEPAKTITVRGLSSEDVMRLVKIHGPAMSAIFDKVTKNAIDLDLNNMSNIASVLLDQAPAIVSDTIVIACDSKDVVAAFEVAQRLPVSAQLKALEAIAELTFVEGGGVGEFFETVIRMMKGTTGLVKTLSQPSQRGSRA